MFTMKIVPNVTDIWGTLVCFTYVDYVVAHDEVLHKPVTLCKIPCRYSEREIMLLSFRDLNGHIQRADIMGRWEMRESVHPCD
jgi:hypothetical protein